MATVLLRRLAGLLLCLGLTLLLVPGCAGTRPTYWRGFSGPAYLPARPTPRPAPAAPALPNAARIRYLDSLTAAKWSAHPLR